MSSLGKIPIKQAWIDNIPGGSLWSAKGNRRIKASVIDGNEEGLVRGAAGLIDALASDLSSDLLALAKFSGQDGRLEGPPLLIHQIAGLT